MSIKNSNDTIENRTRGLPACSLVPQPAACPLLRMKVLLLQNVQYRKCWWMCWMDSHADVVFDYLFVYFVNGVLIVCIWK